MIQLHVEGWGESSQESCQKCASRRGGTSGCRRMSCSRRLWSLSAKTARHGLTSVCRKAVLPRLVVVTTATTSTRRAQARVRFSSWAVSIADALQLDTCGYYYSAVWELLGSAQPSWENQSLSHNDSEICNSFTSLTNLLLWIWGRKHLCWTWFTWDSFIRYFEGWIQCFWQFKSMQEGHFHHEATFHLIEATVFTVDS